MISITQPFFIQRRKDVTNNNRAAQRIQTTQRCFTFAFCVIGNDMGDGFAVQSDCNCFACLHLFKVFG